MGNTCTVYKQEQTISTSTEIPEHENVSRESFTLSKKASKILGISETEKKEHI